MDTKLWIVPQNTLEQKTVTELLLRSNELVVTTNQNVPSWEHLEPKIQAMLENFKTIYGIQLQGTASLNAINIAPSIREGSEETLFVLEQVAKLIDTPLTIDEQFVLANNRGFSAMKDLGKSLQMKPSEVRQKIQAVRLKDRQCQGISQADENNAIHAISQSLKQLPKSGQTYSFIPIQLGHKHFSTVIDRLYGLYENLLITDPDHISHFYGSRDVLEQLRKDFEGGYTDEKEVDGFYYWESDVDSPAIQNSILKFIEEKNIKEEDEKITHLTPHDILNKQTIDGQLGRVMIETPNLKHLSKPITSSHQQTVSRKFYENGSIYSQTGTATIDFTDKMHFINDIENLTQWDDPKKESVYPLSYEEKVLVLLNNGPYEIEHSLVSKNSGKTLIPDIIDLLRQARFSPEQFKDTVESLAKECYDMREKASTYSSNFTSFIAKKEKSDDPEPFEGYEDWCKLTLKLTNKESELELLKKLSYISSHFDSVIEDYETVYFNYNRPKTSFEKKQMEVETSSNQNDLESR